MQLLGEAIDEITIGEDYEDIIRMLREVSVFPSIPRVRAPLLSPRCCVCEESKTRQ